MKMYAVKETLRGNQIFYRNSGYVVINSEIIEFDGVEYSYYDRTGTKKTIVATNYGGIQKILGDIKPGQNPLAVIEQTGRVKIKSRGAFGTKVADHPANIETTIQSWNVYDTTWEIS